MNALTRACCSLALPGLLVAAALTGTVSDPQGRLVPLVQVALTCAGHSRIVRTGPEGRFVLIMPAASNNCVVSIAHPGFAPFRQEIESGLKVLPVQLKLAPLEQTVTVVSRRAGDVPLSHRTLFSVSLDGDELRRISNSTEGMVRYAKLQAGLTGGVDAVYVDGLPGGRLPPAEMVARITVNADPFSAEYADGDQTHIDIVTRSGDRRFRFHMGGSGLGFGGHDTLTPGLGASSKNGGVTVSGAVPGLPVTFSAHLNAGSNHNDVPVLAVDPAAPSTVAGGNRSIRAGSHAKAGSLSLYYSRGETFRANVSFDESHAKGTNIGAGGLTLEDAGIGSSILSRSVRATAAMGGAAIDYRGGLVFTESASTTRANSSAPGLTVEGQFTAGGAPLLSSRSNQTTWTWKNVVSPRSSSWTTGITTSRSQDFQQDAPNPAGTLVFPDVAAYLDGLHGHGTGTWFVTRGNGTARFATTVAAPFVQKELARSERFLLIGGMREDWQARFGAVLSPRVSAAADLMGFVFRIGGGLFVQPLPSAVLLRVVQNDGTHVRRFIATGVPAGAPATPTDEINDHAAIRSQRASDLTQARQWMLKASLERTFGWVSSGIEYSRSQERHLLGSRRLPVADGWLDLLESNRSSNRQRLHAQLRYRRKDQTFAVHYEWSRHRDDTNGAFSFPVHQNNIRAEWSRSAGVSPHTVIFNNTFQLRRGIFLSLTDTWRSSPPYDINTGIDAASNGLFNDRGGRRRNSGNGPTYNSLGFHSSKRFPLPAVAGRLRSKVHLNLGIQGENLLGNTNYIGYGSVAGSPNFGAPLGTLPGRSIRVWLHLD